MEDRDNCNLASFGDLFSILRNTGTLDIATTISSIKASKTGNGVLGEYTTRLLGDPLLDQATKQLLLRTEAVFTEMVTEYFWFGWHYPNITAELLQATPQKLCEDYALFRSGLYPLNANFTDAIVTASANNTEGVDNLCVVVRNIDELRLLSTESLADVEKLDEYIFDSWYGNEVQTPFMAAYNFETTSQEYRARQYYSFWNALEFREADSVNANYAYVAYYNRTGTAGNLAFEDRVGNLLTNVWLVDSAIVSFHTGKVTKVTTKSFLQFSNVTVTSG